MKFFNFKKAIHKGKSNPEVSPAFQVEPLEPRLLLSADMTLSALAGQSLDITLRLDADRQELQIVDNTIHQVIQSQALAEVRAVAIIGADQDDKLTIDLSTPFTLPEGIMFDDLSNDDNDTLQVIGQDNQFNITDQNQGNVNGVITFSCIENLVGDVGSDTFQFTAIGRITGTIDGASGVQDSILVEQSNCNVVAFTYTGPDSGSIKRDGQVVALYARMEAIKLTSSGPSPPANVIIKISSAVADKLIVKDDGVANNGFITIESTKGSFVETTFQVPTGELKVNNGSGIQLMASDQVEEPNFTIYIDGHANEGGGVVLYGEEGDPVNLSYSGQEPVVYYDFAVAFGDGSNNLNNIIDFLLETEFDPDNPPNPSESFGFSVDVVTIGQSIGDGIADLQLQDVTLTFSGLGYNSVDGWTGQVKVEAKNATLFPGLLNVKITDTQKDADLFAAVGIIYLEEGNPNSFMTLDDLEEEDIGWPAFLDIEFTDLRMTFDDFRVDDNQNDLQLTASFLGLDTGNEALNELLSADNLFFGLTVTGSVSLTLAIKEIEDTALAINNLDVIAAMKSALAAAMNSGLTGVRGEISGNLFLVGQLTARFIVNKVTYDPDGTGPLDPRSAVYIAVEGSFNMGEAITGRKGGGSRDGGFGIAFAFSDLGPLQFFIYGGPIKRFEPTTGLTLEEIGLGVRFNTTIEGLQTEPDFDVTGATIEDEIVQDPNDTENPYLYKVTLTIPGHDLKPGDDFRIINADNEFYNGDFTVLTVNGNQVTYRLKYNPGLFVGDAQIIRLTIKDPLDLSDDGLTSGIAPPDDIDDWAAQLDQAVRNQLEAGDDIWARLFGEVVFGGTATVSIDPIPDYIMLYEVNLMIDTDLRIFLQGEMNLFDGLVRFPTRLYADLSELNQGNGRFLYLQTQPEIPVFEPLLVYRGEISFETLVGTDILGATVIDNTANGFWEIELELALDDPSSEYSIGDNAVIFGSIPSSFDWTYEVIGVNDAANTITVQIDCDLDGNGICEPDEIIRANPGIWTSGGKVANEKALVAFRIALEGGVDLNIPGFKVEGGELKAITVTTLTFEGGVAIEFRIPGPSVPEDLEIELSFEAALSETHVGNIAYTAGTFVVTVDVGDILDITDDSIVIYGAARLDTQLDFLENIGFFMDVNGFLRINSSNQNKTITLPDINGNDLDLTLPAKSFALKLSGSVDFHVFGVSVFEMSGIFVLEFSSDGFNAAVFSEDNGNVEAATLRLGPKGNPFIEFDVFAFMAIRVHGDKIGFAANLVLHTEASLPLDLASLHATAVFIVNTMGEDVEFEIPSEDPDRPSGLVLTIPGEAPKNPSAILAGHGPNGQPGVSLDDLINGNTSWIPQDEPGPYGVVFVDGGMNLLSFLGLDVSGYILLSKDVLSLELNFYAGGNFLNLAKASVYGSVFYSSEGEFQLEVFAGVQLGPNGFNISGSAHLFISYLDSNGKASGGDGNRSLNITGNLSVSAEVFWINVGSINLTVGYNSNSGDIIVGVTVPVPYFAKKCWRTFLGRICIWYPSIHNKTYTFTVGNLKLNPPDDPPLPVVLGEVNNEGILVLNVGPGASARNLMNDEQNEGVLIERVGAGSDRGEIITVTMFGYSETFDNVLGVKIPDMGAGEDSVEIYSGVTIPVEVHFGPGNDSLIAAGPGVVIAYGDEGDDNLEGGSGNDRLFGGVGNDVIDGKAGQDWIEGYGEDGPLGEDEDDADVLIGGEDNDTLKGGPGFDRIAGDLAEITGDENASILETIASALGGSDIIDGGEDGDVIFGGSGNDLIDGGPGNDVLIGDDGIVTVSQEDENIIISYTLARLDYSGNDIIIGGADNDTVYGQEGNDILIGDEGSVNDTSAVAYVNDSDGSDTIYGQEGEDKIFGGGGDDYLFGDKEGDSDGSLQRDILIGDGGVINCTADMFAFNDVTMITNSGQLAGGADTMKGNAGADIVLGGAAGDWIYGQAGNDVLLGDIGTIELMNGTLVAISTHEESQGGADTVEGNAGSDIIIGGPNDGGTDTLYGDGMNPGNDDNADIILGDNGVIGFSDGRLVSIETTGESYGGADTIYGNGGNDILIGGPNGSTDKLYGNAGDDLMLGDNGLLQFNDEGDLAFVISALDEIGGTDEIAGNIGEDVIIGGTGNDQIYGDDAAASGGGQDGADVIVGDNGEIALIGGSIAQVRTTDTQASTGGIDTIYGNNGDDTIFGGVNGDVLYGNDGNDILLGDNGLHRRFIPFRRVALAKRMDGIDIYEEITPNAVTLDSDASNSAGLGEFGRMTWVTGSNWEVTVTDGTEGGEDTIYGGSGNDMIYGQLGADTLYGGGDNDVMFGGSGDDFMDGEDGDDYMEGNSGSDTMFGGQNEDDMIGGSSDLTVPDQDDGSAERDVMDGGDGHDVLLGDNGRIIRQVDPETNQFIRYTSTSTGVGTGLGLENNAVIRDIILLNQDEIGGNDEIHGGEGDDILHGGFGDDYLYGDAGNDEMYGELGNDTMDGGDGDDGMIGDKGILVGDILDGSAETTLQTPSDVLHAHINTAGTVKWFVSLEDAGIGGQDTMYGGAGNDAMHGGFGNDAMFGDEGNDAMFGNLGNDTMNGGADSDHLYGGGGDDNVDGGIGSDIICGGDGSDYLVADSVGDRLIDWRKPYNTFVKPTSSNGFPIVIISRIPWVQQFLFDLAAADGAVNPIDEILIEALNSV